jgi:lipoprotein-releasing system ATP-binding protein
MAKNIGAEGIPKATGAAKLRIGPVGSARIVRSFVILALFTSIVASPLLQAINIHKSYNSLNVLKGIDLTIEKSEIVSIVGSSGAGKSTLLHILGTLDSPDSGEVLFDGELVSALGRNDLARFRNRHIGFIFQFHNLLPEFTALENVCLPAYLAGRTEKEVRVRARELLAMMNMEHRAEHKPSEMSGGEQQRVSVARSLINSPEIIFADEPSGNLDTKNAQELHQIFFLLRKELGQTFVIVTHNDQLAEMADRKIVMRDGHILEGG